MSRLSSAKFLVVFAILAFPTGFAKARVFSLGDQTWELEPVVSSSAPSFAVRSRGTVAELSERFLLGASPADSLPVYDQATAVAIEQLAAEVNQPAQNARLIIENGRATTFEPPRSGQTLDQYALLALLQTPTDRAALPVLLSEPAVKLSETNSLGINELVAIGESDFSGSPNNRIVNIRVGASRFNGVIVQPGEEFSFNKFLGDVDAEHGFLPELVIKPGGVVPEFGGGLCQVSTTAFRAAMNAGTPITARRNHSFAVQYYAPQGTDATIYPGVSDMKFINDLPGSLLIRTRIAGRKLYFEFYGTKDDRQVAFDGPRQYDKKSNGAMKATWTRHVTLNGQIATQTFNSTYQPPALFHREAAPQSSTPNPEAPPDQPTQ